MTLKMGLVLKAVQDDLDAIVKFTDYWLAGRGCRVNAPGAVNDCFISPSQHKKYIIKYQTYIVREDEKIIAWAVIQYDGSMIHFLIAGTHRHCGMGSQLLNVLDPPKIHSKSNQSTGDPGPFYEKHGYKKIVSVQSRSRLDIDKIKPDRKRIIDIYEKIA